MENSHYAFQTECKSSTSKQKNKNERKVIKTDCKKTKESDKSSKCKTNIILLKNYEEIQPELKA